MRCSHEQNVSRNSTTYQFLSKLLMLGESNVGKTSLVKRYSQNIFPEGNTLLTVGIDISKINKTIDDKNICLQLWDTAGQQKYKTLPAMYFKNMQGIILVYDITDSTFFQQLESWINKIHQNCNLQKLALILVGNKADLQCERQVSKEEATDFSQKNKMKFKETSAKTGVHVEQMINQIMATVIERNLLLERRHKGDVTISRNKIKQGDDSCC